MGQFRQRIRSRNMIKITAAFALMASNLVLGEIGKEEVIMVEQLAFRQCDTDGNHCLSWEEVDKCEETFGPMLIQQGLELPSQDDFNAIDAVCSHDNCMTYLEWEISVGLTKQGCDGESTGESSEESDESNGESSEKSDESSGESSEKSE